MSLLGGAVFVVASCSPGPIPTAVGSEQAAVSPTSRSNGPGALLAVTFGGKIHCASIQSGCGPTLSVLRAGTIVGSDWRPATTDPRWAPDYSIGWGPDHFDPAPLGDLPTIPIGRHEIVISLLGSSDVPSYNPDGSRAFDLLGRCMSDVDVGSATGLVKVLVRFTPDSDSFRASCVLAVTQRS